MNHDNNKLDLQFHSYNNTDENKYHKLFKDTIELSNQMNYESIDKVVSIFSITQTFLRHGGEFFICYRGNERVAMGYIKNGFRHGHAARLDLLFVYPEYRNQGIATQIVKIFILKYNLGAGFTLSCEKDLVKFYRKIGLVKPIKNHDNRRYYTLHSKKQAIDTLFNHITAPAEEMHKYYHSLCEQLGLKS